MPVFPLALKAILCLFECSRGGRTRGFVQCSVAGNPGTLRPEVVTFQCSIEDCGWKAPKSIYQLTSPGFPRLRSGQGLRLRALRRSLCDRSARRFAQDDGFVRGSRNIRLGVRGKHEKIKAVR